jgi:hypothetical protein
MLSPTLIPHRLLSVWGWSRCLIHSFPTQCAQITILCGRNREDKKDPITEIREIGKKTSSLSLDFSFFLFSLFSQHTLPDFTISENLKSCQGICHWTSIRIKKKRRKKKRYLSVYDSRDGVSERAASPSTPSSLMHVHRCIGSHNATRQTLPTSVKLTYLSMYDSRDGVSEHGAPPSSPSSLTHVHRCIGSHNATRQTLPTSVKLTHLSMCDNRNGSTQCMWDV